MSTPQRRLRIEWHKGGVHRGLPLTPTLFLLSLHSHLEQCERILDRLDHRRISPELMFCSLLHVACPAPTQEILHVSHIARIDIPRITRHAQQREVVANSGQMADPVRVRRLGYFWQLQRSASVTVEE